jgi:hypothetical protein
MAEFTTVCDAIATELQTNVAALAAMTHLTVHKYSPWDPEDLAASPGDDAQHLAVWPVGEEAETATPFVTAPGGDLIEQRYRVMYWEHIGKEGSLGTTDETATTTLFGLHAAIRARFYDSSNTQLGGTVSTRYLGSIFPNRAGGVRWFALAIACFDHVVIT